MSRTVPLRLLALRPLAAMAGMAHLDDVCARPRSGERSRTGLTFDKPQWMAQLGECITARGQVQIEAGGPNAATGMIPAAGRV